MFKRSFEKMNKKQLNILVLLVSFIFIVTNAFAEDNNPSFLFSESAVLMDAKTGQILFEKNMNKKESPASTTKIMTGLLALETGKMDDMITMSKEAVFSIERDSSHIALNVGEQISVKDAMYALAVESANDAANGVGEYIGGTSEHFLELMNKRAKELGALNTNFVNTNGLYNANHYSTAYDMALILRQGIKTPRFLEFFNTSRYTIPPTNLQSKERFLNNKNSLLNGKYGDVGLIASKTGYTVVAKHTLVTAAKRGNRELIVVVLNSDKPKDKYFDTIKLLNYGFNEFNEVTIGNEFINNNIGDDEGNKELKDLINSKPFSGTLLLYKNLSLKDIAVKYEENDNRELDISFSLKNSSSQMYGDLGRITIKTPKNLNHYVIYNGKSIVTPESIKIEKYELVIKSIIAVLMTLFFVFSFRTVQKILKD